MDRREKESEDMFDGYDPELVREAIAATAGSWADLDIEAIVEEVLPRPRGGFKANFQTLMA